jgi:hypothetical protein
LIITRKSSKLATFLHDSWSVRHAPLPCPTRSTKVLAEYLASLTAAGCLFSLTLACGSSATTSVTAPSSATSARCQPNVSSPTTSFGSGGGAGTVSVTVERDCTWSVTTQSPWIAFTSSANGQGDGSVAYRISANADPVSRTGSIDIADRHVSIAQDAAPCRYDVAPSSSAVQSQGGELTVTVHTHSACAWTATSQVAWASISPASGKGDATVRVQVASNAGAARAVSLMVAGTPVSAMQSAATAPPPTPTPAPTPTPTPTPTPSPTPSPTPTPTPVPVPVKPIQLSGKAGPVSGTCPAITFQLKERTIYTTPLTVFTRTSCGGVAKGMDLEIKGMEMSDGQIRADEVRRK